MISFFGYRSNGPGLLWTVRRDCRKKYAVRAQVQRQTDRLGCFPLCFQERCAEPLCDGSLLTDVFPFITIDKIE